MRRAAWALAALLAGAPCAARDIVAVVSSSAGPYRAGYAEFVKAFGRNVPSYPPRERPSGAVSGARVVVAFGGEAAVAPYPKSAILIVCLAPGIFTRLPHEGPVVFLTMKPAPPDLLAKIKLLQPKLTRLAVVSSSADSALYLAELRKSAAGGPEIIDARVSGPAEIPDALRAIEGKADALWLSPDPALVTPQTFELIKQFSWDHNIPFYAPTEGLVGAGAAAGVSVTPEAAGRQAAEAARRQLAGLETGGILYPAELRLTVNLPSAAKSGLKIDPGALGKVDHVIR